MKRLIWILAIGVVALLAVIWAAPARAQGGQPGGPVTDDQVNAVARQLYCPVCENIPLDACPTQACSQWREQIRTMLGEGKSPQEIKDYFVAQYGDRVLATPPARGLNWLVYIIPPIAILAGAYILFRAFQAWRSPEPAAGAAPPPAPTQNDEYVARLEEELKRR